MGQPDAGVTVVVFSTDTSTWNGYSRRLAAIRPDQYGEWEVVGLPDGDYWVGLESRRCMEFRRPARLAELGLPMRVTLKEGERTIANTRRVDADSSLSPFVSELHRGRP
jgi:hypothetical protein